MDTFNIQKAIQQVRKVVSSAVETWGEGHKEELKADLGKGQPPSHAGEYPHKDSGELVDSIKGQKQEGNDISFTIWTDDEKAKALSLEFGSKNMAARPFMYPNAMKMRGDLQGLADKIRQGLS